MKRLHQSVTAFILPNGLIAPRHVCLYRRSQLVAVDRRRKVIKVTVMLDQHCRGETSHTNRTSGGGEGATQCPHISSLVGFGEEWIGL